MNEPIKCLSIRQPWAEMILHHNKSAENRTWNTGYRGPLVIHAGKARASRDDVQTIRDMFDIEVDRDKLTYGAFVGVVELYDVAEPGAYAGLWHDTDCYGFKLRHAFPFTHGIAGQGRLGLFTPPDNVLDLTRRIVAHALSSRLWGPSQGNL